MEGRRAAWLAFLRTLLRFGTFFALAGLVVDFGMPISDAWRGTIRTGQLLLVVLFAVHTALELIWTVDRRRFLRHHWLEVGLFTVMLVDVTAGIALERAGPLAGAWFFGVQAYLIVRLLLSLASFQEWFSRRTLRPALWLLATFLGLALAGAGLLLLPLSRASGAEPWTFTDAFFTATSAVCVTGLSVRDIGTQLSFRGQALLLGLIQVGGLGLVAIACGTAFLQRGRLSMRESRVLGEAIGFASPGRLRKFLVFAIVFTLVLEAAGAMAILALTEKYDHEPHGQVWWAVFHSVSAFCNAGFSLSSTSLVPYSGDAALLGVFGFLIVMGGLGFAVHMDLLGLRPLSLATLRWLRWQLSESVRWPWRHAVFQGAAPPRLALSTRLVLTTTGILLVGGTFVILISESRELLKPLDISGKWLAAAFASISARTAGFQTLDPAEYAGPTLLATMLLMIVGASPLSTGGGVKTSTLAVAALTLRAMTRDRDQVEAFGRSIPRQVVNACVAITALYALSTILVTTALLSTQHELAFEKAIFESVSALSTVGLSMNTTAELDTTGRWILSAAMIAGRIGPLACLWSFVARGRGLRYRYPDENVIIS